uniref:GDNF/GAS1 domain-containing protein n=1 Tax=Esox lucius TaxID=8010 RepID=A0A3P8YWV6_ESOLU
EARSSSFTSSWNPMQEPQINTRDSCLSALESCQISHRCAVVYKKLKDSCQTRNDQCNFPGSGDSCLSLWMELQGTSLSNCTCSLRRRKCQGIWRGVNNNPFHETGGSCLQQMTICLSDEVCNRWMVPLVEACSSSQCNSTSCQQMAQQFYAGLPYNVAQMFVLCDCEQGDQDCLHVKKGLHSGTCGEHLEEARLPICLEIFDNCLMEANCRNRLEALLSECWDTEDTQCSDYGVDTCISYLDFALILGGDPECQMALTATMGTTLQHPCTCKGLYNRDLFKCNMIHELLHNRTHYSETVMQNFHLIENGFSQSNQLTYQFFVFSDQLLCVLAYVLLVVAVLMAIMILLYRR